MRRLPWFFLILILLVIQNFVGSVAEEEIRAAWMGVLFLGIPAVILGVLAVRLPLQRHSPAWQQRERQRQHCEPPP